MSAAVIYHQRNAFPEKAPAKVEVCHSLEWSSLQYDLLVALLVAKMSIDFCFYPFSEAGFLHISVALQLRA